MFGIEPKLFKKNLADFSEDNSIFGSIKNLRNYEIQKCFSCCKRDKENCDNDWATHSLNTCENIELNRILANKRTAKKHWYSYLVFAENNFYYQIYNFIISVSCLISSYMYIYMAAFRLDPPQNDTFLWTATTTFESMFLFYMILQFFREYTPDLQINKPVQDIKLIA